MKVSAVFKSIVSLVLIIVVGILSACSSSSAMTQSTALATTASLATNPPDVVEVNYFHEEDACFCLTLASKWVDDTISNDYKSQLASGKLVYKTYNSQDPTNDAVMKQFNASLTSLFITTVRGTVRNTHEVAKLWLYTDSTGKNEVLHTDFVKVLKGEIDQALAGS